MLIRWWRNQWPGALALKSRKLFWYSTVPHRGFRSFSEIRRFSAYIIVMRRELDMMFSCKKCLLFANARLRPSYHMVGIGRGNTCGRSKWLCCSGLWSWLVKENHRWVSWSSRGVSSVSNWSGGRTMRVVSCLGTRGVEVGEEVVRMRRIRNRRKGNWDRKRANVWR